MITTEFYLSPMDISMGFCAAYKIGMGAPCYAQSSLISDTTASYSNTIYDEEVGY
jgi:hypothetical protein